MPLQTDFNVSPYFDDFAENKDFYKVLFRPGVAVQARELNQLQTILQKQIERFGDNIFKRGTIIDGCDITFHSVFPYVKIRDNETDGAPVNVLSYVGYNVRNQANITPLVASITTVISGFESRNPDLNTLYVRYVNSGYSNVGGVATEESVFAANQQLTVYDPDNIIEKVTSYNDSSGFSNTDSVVIMSAVAIQNSTGGKTFTNNFYVGDYVNNTVANAEVVAVDTTSNSTAVILRLRPRAVDLKMANSDLWSFSTNDNIQSTNAAPSDVATIVGIVGSGAAGSLKTGALGEVDTIAITSKGSGYYVLPTVTIASPGATTGQIATANLIAQNYLTTITVANAAVTPIGTGYAMTVGPGVIYQKGYFSRVNEHLVVVDKYANTPDALAVGFDTTEAIIDSSTDTSLLDNATGSPNETAPGANRLKLTPTLVTMSKAQADANSEFFSIAEFTEGNPYKQNRQTVYNIIGNEMARRTYEESGNYVLDQFILNTKSSTTLADEATTFKIQIDPGAAYVNGKRVETIANYETSVNKGIDTVVANNVSASLNYGNYIRVNEMGGTFVFKAGDLVSLYPTARHYMSNSAIVGTAPSSAGLGTSLGTARIRSVVHESGIPGTAEAVYRLYLFDVRLATARNFKLIRSVYYGGTNSGIADVVLENGDAVLKDNNLSSLLYYAGVPAVKVANNLSYVYRTISNTLSLATNGVISFSVSGGETFPYTGGSVLSSAQERDLIVIPLANVQNSANITGTISCNTTSTQVNGAATAFQTELQAGDFLKINGSTIVQVNNIVSNTVLFVRSNPAAGAAANAAAVYYPQNVPISLERSTRTANVNINSNTMYISLGAAVNTATAVAVTYNVRSSNTQPVTKTVNRDRYVRLYMANNAATTKGPWALGLPDVFRLKGVYKGPNATFTDTDTVNVTDVTNSFYIDHNQTEDYYGISYLYPKPGSLTTLSGSDYLLVKFDHFTDSGEGMKAPGDSGTYNIDDTVALNLSTASINTLEIPEVYGVKGDYYDLRDQFDFRPQSANTIAASTTAATAPLNPTEPTSANRFSTTDKKFPAPDSSLTGLIEYYVGRTDRVIIDEGNQFHVMPGVPGSSVAPTSPNNALTVNLLTIPPYPSVPAKLSAQTIQFVDTGIANEKYSGKRLKSYTVTTPIDAAERKQLQPRGYTMVDIGKLEKRISDLEYYTTFTMVEQMTQKRNIPSSSNTSVERFKFGFFVDSFDNYKYAEIDNPGYRASVVNGFLSPQADEINLSVEPAGGGSVSVPHIEYTLVSQTKATDGPVSSAGTGGGGANSYNGSITVVPGSSTSTTSTVTVQEIATVHQTERSRSASSSAPYVYDEWYYTMSSTAGPVEIYVNNLNTIQAMEIFQSSSPEGPWVSVQSSATAAAITSADIVTKGLYFRQKVDHPGSLQRRGFGPVGGFIDDQFKLTWTHEPAQGRYYKIRAYKGGKTSIFSWQGSIEFKMFFPIDGYVNRIIPVTGFTTTTNYSIGYNGLVVINSGPIQVLWSGIGPWGIPIPFWSRVAVVVPNTTSYSTADTNIHVTVSGLKPSTVHTVLLDGVDVTSRIKQTGKLLGGGVGTDENGTIDMNLYYGSEIAASSDVEKAAAAVLQSAGTKTLKIQSADGTSVATNTIQVPGYVKSDMAQPTIVYPVYLRPWWWLYSAWWGGYWPGYYGTYYV